VGRACRVNLCQKSRFSAGFRSKPGRPDLAAGAKCKRPLPPALQNAQITHLRFHTQLPILTEFSCESADAALNSTNRAAHFNMTMHSKISQATKSMNRMFSMVAMAAALALAGCGKSKDSSGSGAASDLGKEAGDAVATARQTVSEAGSKFMAATEARLQVLDTKIAGVASQTGLLAADAKAEGKKVLDALMLQRVQLAQALEEAKTASQNSSDALQAKFNTLLSDLEKACDAAAAKLAGTAR
jgi:hypothetical protein